MTWVAVAIAGAGVLTAATSARSAKKAGEMQGQASAEAVAEQRRQFDIARSDLAPFREAGTEAVGRLRDLTGLSGRGFTEEDLLADPITGIGFRFGLDEGRKGINRMAGARGLRDSGATLKALTRFGQDYAGSKAEGLFNRLSSLSGTGQTATTNTAQLGSQMAGNVGNILTASGNARGASRIAQGQAWGDAFNTIGNWWAGNQNRNMQMEYLKALNRGQN